MHTIPTHVTGEGTYILWLFLHNFKRIQVGSLGTFDFMAGYYAYIGSALGPGGLAARLKRHFTRDKPLRWHIDYLTVQLKPFGAWYINDQKRWEHLWANAFQVNSETLMPVKGFGATDCGCPSHLFFFDTEPFYAELMSRMQKQLSIPEGKVGALGKNFKNHQ